MLDTTENVINLYHIHNQIFNILTNNTLNNLILVIQNLCYIINTRGETLEVWGEGYRIVIGLP